ncbi:hypothetical protein [Caballeronia sp. TF1N1]|uniref:hypothetical protein n=1 Tax=Caballeronia sp. TF1N1 TaxID=2878153 RepID=UPI001FD5193C|nr:hypothetical protein [Caballeronia sp. TF1N1]
MSTKHTPGPWSIWTSNSYRRIGSDAPRGGEVLCGSVQRDGCADLYFPNGGYEGPDARLVTAAPDLLASLRTTVSMLQGTLLIITDKDARAMAKEAIAEARAAIAKATGEKA